MVWEGGGRGIVTVESRRGSRDGRYHPLCSSLTTSPSRVSRAVVVFAHVRPRSVHTRCSWPGGRPGLLDNRLGQRPEFQDDRISIGFLLCYRARVTVTCATLVTDIGGRGDEEWTADGSSSAERRLSLFLSLSSSFLLFSNSYLSNSNLNTNETSVIIFVYSIKIFKSVWGKVNEEEKEDALKFWIRISSRSTLHPWDKGMNRNNRLSIQIIWSKKNDKE